MPKYKIIVYTLCWNEIDILPFVIDYWKAMGISKAVVYDNESDDEMRREYRECQEKSVDINEVIRQKKSPP